MKRAYLISALFAFAALPIHGGIFITEAETQSAKPSAFRLFGGIGAIALRRQHVLT